MIKLLLVTTLLNVGELNAVVNDPPKVEARKRGKGQRGRKRGGGGLR